MRIAPQHGGWIELIVGPMFSGKSDELIRRLDRAMIAGQRVQVYKPAIDERYSADQVASHAGARIDAVAVTDTAAFVEQLRQIAATHHHHELPVDVIGIDEIQFMSDGIVEAVDALASRGVRVIASGLDQDFARRPFAHMPQLLAHAEFVDKLQAICMVCSGSASCTQRLIDGKPARLDDPLVQVGAAESYEARCRMCHRITP